MSKKGKDKSGRCIRAESVNIGMDLDKKAFDRHEEVVRILVPNFKGQLKQGDNLKVSYDFFIMYFGDVVKKLTAVAAICDDPDVVLSASCEELEEGEILCYEVLNKLKRVIALVKNRVES